MFCRLLTAVVILFSAALATLPASALSSKAKTKGTKHKKHRTIANVKKNKITKKAITKKVTPTVMDEALPAAAGRMKVKDYSGAREAALKINDKGPRAMLLGMADLRLEQWDEAAAQLAVAADSYPILADYALYNEGLALSKLSRADQALPPLYKLLQQYPESRLARPAMLLYADSMAAAGHQKEALDSYTLFIERYPAGSDSISALYGSALCRQKLGDAAGAASVLRGVWLSYPGSTVADKASSQLDAIAAAGTRVEPYTSSELFKRACTLYDLGRYSKAADAFSRLPGGGSDDFSGKVQLKLGQALFKAKRYQEAQATLGAVMQKGGAGANEAGYWLGRTLDKTGKSDEAYSLYLRLADLPKSVSIADDALLEAAYLKRYQKKWSEAQQLFKRYLALYPEQNNSGALWEAAWTSYQSRDYQGAAGYLRKLAEHDDLREKALYWLGKTLTASGDSKGAEASFAALGAEYPFGYYALICNRWCEASQFPAPPRSLAEALPMPAGFEREKALIALGLYDEAARELGSKRNKNPLGAARLYLEMDNYNGAFHSIGKDKPRRSDSASIWGLAYPLAYGEDVSKNAAANAVPESLVYSIMRAESNYSPAALSPVGAVGLMQIMPATAEAISKGGSGKLSRPELNIRLGTRHLKDLLAAFNHNIAMVAAAYNAGSGNVRRWQKGLGTLPQDEFIESIPFKETREYVKKVVTGMELYQRLYRLPKTDQKP